MSIDQAQAQRRSSPGTTIRTASILVQGNAMELPSMLCKVFLGDENNSSLNGAFRTLLCCDQVPARRAIDSWIQVCGFINVEIFVNFLNIALLFERGQPVKQWSKLICTHPFGAPTVLAEMHFHLRAARDLTTNQLEKLLECQDKIVIVKETRMWVQAHLSENSLCNIMQVVLGMPASMSACLSWYIVWYAVNRFPAAAASQEQHHVPLTERAPVAWDERWGQLVDLCKGVASPLEHSNRAKSQQFQCLIK